MAKYIVGPKKKEDKERIVKCNIIKWLRGGFKE